jgi:hypothetical protein
MRNKHSTGGTVDGFVVLRSMQSTQLAFAASKCHVELPAQRFTQHHCFVDDPMSWKVALAE